MTARDAPPPFRTRTDVLFATRAPLAVVLRRGPRTHWQLMLWNTRRDIFTPGQWLKGLVRLMDLSPRGDKLIYWAAQYHPRASWQRRRDSGTSTDGYEPLVADHRVIQRQMKRYRNRKLPRYLSGQPPGRPAARPVMGAWTAVSTPPYFSALAIWPTIGHWTGGGFFKSDNRIVLYEGDCGLTPIENARIPVTTMVSPWNAARALLPPPTTLAINPGREPTERKLEIKYALEAAGARYVDWTHVEAGGDILFACDGSIYRHPPIIGPIDAEVLQGAKRLIDLAPARFELVRAPNAAMRW